MPRHFRFKILLVLACFGSAAQASQPAVWQCIELLAQERGGAGAKPTRVDDIARFLSLIYGKDYRYRLSKEFTARQSFFSDPRITPLLDRRVEFLTEQSHPVPNNVLDTKDPVLWDMLTLLSIFPSLKEIVWQKGASGRADLERMSVNPGLYWNVQDPTVVWQHVTALSNTPSHAAWLISSVNPDLKHRTGYVVADFLKRPELRQIYADDLADSLVIAARKKLGKKGAAVASNQLLQLMLDALDPRDEVTYNIPSRKLEALVGGDWAGDCTACGSDNYWANGSWNLVFENQEIRTFFQKKFFARFVQIAGTENERPILYAHAAEFTPLVDPSSDTEADSPLAEEENQKIALDRSLRILWNHALRAGFYDVKVTGVSNSSDWVPMLQEHFESQGVYKANTPSLFELLNPLDSAHEIQRDLRGVSKPIPIYLQGWETTSGFEYQTRLRTGGRKSVELGGQSVPIGEFNRAATLFYHYLENKIVNGYAFSVFPEDLQSEELEGFNAELPNAIQNFSDDLLAKQEAQGELNFEFDPDFDERTDQRDFEDAMSEWGNLSANTRDLINYFMSIMEHSIDNGIAPEHFPIQLVKDWERTVVNSIDTENPQTERNILLGLLKEAQISQKSIDAFRQKITKMDEQMRNISTATKFPRWMTEVFLHRYREKFEKQLKRAELKYAGVLAAHPAELFAHYALTREGQSGGDRIERPASINSTITGFSLRALYGPRP